MALKKILMIFFAAFLLCGCVQQNEMQKEELTVYTYDSMVSEYGLGPKIIPKFEEKCNCKVNMVAKGDAGQVLTVLEIEKNSPKADVVIGLDNSLMQRAKKANVLEKFTPKNIGIVPQDLMFDKDGYLTPYDYGFIAFVYDAKKIPFVLDSFDSMVNKELENKIAIQNPRTSSPGLALLLWTVAVYGEPGYKDFWKKFKPNILTVTQGWDESAGLFSAGEIPIYLSYATSPPYYAIFEDKNYVLAAEFSEGHYIQIEGVGIVRGTKKRELAGEFIEFALEESFQNEIPLNQYMFPVNQNAILPDSFDYAILPKKLGLDGNLVEQKQEEWISEWEKIMISG